MKPIFSRPIALTLSRNLLARLFLLPLIALLSACGEPAPSTAGSSLTVSIGAGMQTPGAHKLLAGGSVADAFPQFGLVQLEIAGNGHTAASINRDFNGSRFLEVEDSEAIAITDTVFDLIVPADGDLTFTVTIFNTDGYRIFSATNTITPGELTESNPTLALSLRVDIDSQVPQLASETGCEDSDGDDFCDVYEDLFMNADGVPDVDADGIINSLDSDADGDGEPDVTDGNIPSNDGFPTFVHANRAPTDVALTLRTDKDLTVSGAPGVSDPDEGDCHVITVVSPPQHGTASVVAEGRVDPNVPPYACIPHSVHYTPNEGFVGGDTFSIRAADRHGLSVEGVATVEVLESGNTRPSLADDTANTPAATAITLDVLANDADGDGDTLTLVAVSEPDHGTASVTDAGVLYTPDADFSGVDSFTYSATDGRSDPALATVTVTVDDAAVSVTSYTLTYSAGANGSINGTTTQSVNHGGDGTTVTAVPDTGYHFVDWSDGSTVNPRTDTGVTGDISVTANFAPIVSYTIGGTLSGLDGVLTLQNKGGDDLQLADDGPFAFDSPVASGDTYEVTIKSQPVDQQCSLLGGSGVVAGDVTNIEVQCFQALALHANPLAKAVELSWNDVPANGFDLYYSTSPDCDITYIDACPGGGLITGVGSPYTHTGLTNGQHYSYWLRANYAGGHATVAEGGARPDNLYFNNPLYALATDAGGTAYLGGDFTHAAARAGYGVALATTSSGTRPFPLVNGRIWAVVADGMGGWYIGGMFTQVGTESRLNLAHILADGSVDPAWAPQADSFVHALALSGSTLYVGGGFTTVSDAPQAYLAAIDAIDGTVDTSWSPILNGTVWALAVDGSTVYAGGDFTSTNGDALRSRIAAIDTITAEAHGDFPAADNTVYAITISDSTVYVGGAFSTLGGAARARLGAVASDGTLRDWNPAPDNTVRAIAVEGSTVYLGGDFTNISVGGVEAQPARVYMGAINTDGTLSDWNPTANAKVHALLVDGSTVYAGGEFSTVTVDGSAAQRTYIAAVGTDGALHTWSPQLGGGVITPGVYALALNGETLYAVGSLATVGGVTRNRLAAVSADGTLSPWNPSAGGTVFALAVNGSTVYAGGSFTTMAGATRNRLAAVGTDGTLATWNPNANTTVYALAATESTVYAGGSFTSLGLNASYSHLAAISAIDGVPNPDFPVADGTVYALATHGTMLYVGGSFGSVGNEGRANIAAVDTATGQVSTAWWPSTEGTVRALVASDSAVYVGGDFTSINGDTSRDYLAALNTTDGTHSSTFPTANSSVRALALSGSVLYAGGSFLSLGGQLRDHLAAIDVLGTEGTVNAWGPDASGALVYALEATGTEIYIGGAFTSVDGDVAGRFTAVAP